MNQYAMRSPLAACEEVRSPLSGSDRRNPVFCPKPRRMGPVMDPIRPLRWHAWYQTDLCDSRSGPELLDIFLPKGDEQPQSPISSSPDFFCGSPPSRVSNPIVQDTRFGEDRPIIFAPSPFTNNSPFPISNQSAVAMSPRKGCVRTVSNFGFQPAPVRIEGFDCLENRDSRRRGITAVA